MAEQKDIDEWMAKFRWLPESAIRAMMAQFKPHAAAWIAGDIIIKQRDREQASAPTELLAKLNDHATRLDARVANIEGVAKRPEYKTFAFWIGLIGILLASLAIIIAWLAWQRPVAVAVDHPPAASAATAPTPK